MLGNICIIRDDELVEITPGSIRMRKKELDSALRRKNKRDEKSHNWFYEILFLFI